jgi:DNA-binding MarR family transcriptional regulator
VTRTTSDDVLLALVRLAMDASVRASDDLGGVSPVQLRALTAIGQRGRLNLAQLAEEMGVTVSTASRLVDRLVSVAWVNREPSASDRREISLSLTPTGEELLQRYDELRVHLLQECLRRVPADRRAAVIEALADLADLAHP